jgi:predicted Zn-dependent protease
MNRQMERIVRLVAGLVATAALFTSSMLPAAAYSDQEQWELQVGQQYYQQLAQQGKIVHSSPYYHVLNPIAARISRVADGKYFVPFHFILVNDSSPNAFAVPGGNVYVTTSMMTFARSEQELAGVLCHETSHDIHHDVYNNARKDQTLGLAAGILGLLVGRNSQTIGSLINLGANLQALNFSREVESNADHTGAYTCAQAGENPWGMVWLFKRFESKPSGVPLEMLSDHPRDDHRVTDLENLFANDPETFRHFSSNEATAKPL